MLKIKMPETSMAANKQTNKNETKAFYRCGDLYDTEGKALMYSQPPGIVVCTLLHC